MQIAIIHLSDIHFIDTDSSLMKHSYRIIQSLKQFSQFEHLFFIFSGDIAYSGHKNEYKNADIFFTQLKILTEETFNLKTIPTFQIVPGNHDVCLDDAFNHDALQKIYKEGNVEKYIPAEKAKQLNYFEFSRKYGCSDLHKELVYAKRYDFQGYSIEFSLLNSALFSMRDQEKGMHYLPSSVIDALKKSTDADLTISIMHHSFHWFNDTQKSLLERILLSKSDMIFFGHEHKIGQQSIIPEYSPATHIFSGGELGNQNNWVNSAFSVCLFETEKRSIEKTTFLWNEEASIYLPTGPVNFILPNRHTRNIPLVVKESFRSSLYNDDKNSISDSAKDYFVFPRLRQQCSGEYTDEKEYVESDAFINCILSNKRIYIVGVDNSGKSLLLKHIFDRISLEMCVLFCDLNTITSGNRRRIIKSVFEDIYSDNPIDFAVFQQLDKSQKAIIIDDVHKIKQKHFSDFIKDIESEFGYIILGSGTVNELDIVERVKTSLSSYGYARYLICPFYTDKRNALIEKLLYLHNPDQNITELKAVLVDAFKQQRKFLSYTPDIIIRFFLYYQNNMSESVRNDGSIFGKVFEASIIDLVAPFVKNMSVDKFFIIMDKVAFHIHKNKLYPLPQSEFIFVIEQYQKEYGTTIDISELFKIIFESKLMKYDEEKSLYLFTNNSYLAYFIAREIKRRITDSGDLKDLKHILEFACFGINADILIILTYITDNKAMLTSILDAAMLYLENWPEYNNTNIPLISGDVDIDVGLPSPDESKRLEQHELAEEKSQVDASEIQANNIYDFCEEEVRLLYHQLIRACSLMTVVSRCLPNFEHMMPADMKNKFVNAVYQMPQKVYYRWAIEISNNIGVLVDILYQALEEQYKIDPTQKLFSRDDIFRALQNDVVIQYLNFLYATVALATKKHTIDYLNDFDYMQATVYRIQHIMMLEKMEKTTEFLNESARFYDSTKKLTEKSLLKHIMRHYILNSKRITPAIMQQIEDKYFGGTQNHQTLLAQRHKTH